MSRIISLLLLKNNDCCKTNRQARFFKLIKKIVYSINIFSQFQSQQNILEIDASQYNKNKNCFKSFKDKDDNILIETKNTLSNINSKQELEESLQEEKQKNNSRQYTLKSNFNKNSNLCFTNNNTKKIILQVNFIEQFVNFCFNIRKIDSLRYKRLQKQSRVLTI